MAQMNVYDTMEEKARRFAELMNDMEWHTKRELLDELEISVSTLNRWLRDKNIERTEGEEQVHYIKYGKNCTKIHKVLKYRVKEKMQVKVTRKNSLHKNYANNSNNKWGGIIKEIIGDRKEIKRNDLVDIGIKLNFNESVKKLIMLTEELGVRVV